LILVDSSVWIDYFKGTITAPRHLDTPAVSLPRLVTTWLRSRQTGDVVPSGDWPGCAWITGHSERCLLAVRGATTPIPCTREMIEREMKTADFKGELTPNGHIAVPPDVAALVPPGHRFRWYPSRAVQKTTPHGAQRGGDGSRPGMPPTTRSMNR
jgi:hypothetical protein